MTHSASLHRHLRSSFSFLLLPLLVLGSFSFRAEAQWVEKPAQGFTTADFNGVAFPSPSMGYAIGTLSGTDGLFKTTDGGEKWGGVGMKDMWLFGIEFTDEDNGYLCGRWNSYECGVIVRTVNGGLTWTPDTVQGTFGLYTVDFPTQSVGYACGYLGTIVKTTNSGGSWSRLNTGTATDVFTDISFPTADTGIAIAGKNGEFFRPDQVYRTVDGGASWIKLHDFETRILVTDAVLVNGTTGYLVCASDGDMILKTTDAGITWDTVYRRIGEPRLVSARFVNATNGFVVGDKGTILHTVDGGITWIDESLPIDGLLAAIDVTGSSVWALGSSGTILKRQGTQASIETYIAAGPLSYGAMLITPNPFNGYALARLTTPLREGRGIFTLHDALGNEVRRFELTEPAASFAITSEGLPAGLYFYRVVSGGDIIGTGPVIIR